MTDEWKRLDRHGLSSEPGQPVLMAPTVDKLDEYADRIAELEAKLRNARMSELLALGQSQEAYEQQLAAEAKLAKAVESFHDIAKDLDKPESGLTDFGEREHYRMAACKLRDKARTTLAELTGGKDEDEI